MNRDTGSGQPACPGHAGRAILLRRAHLALLVGLVLLAAGCGLPASPVPLATPSLPVTPDETLAPGTALPLPTAPAPTATPQAPPFTPTPILAPSPVMDGDIVTALNAFLSTLAQETSFSGAVLVARDGQVLLSKGYGLADRAQNIANSPQTRFRIGSITKPFTALAVLQLQAQGQLDVQDPICDYLEDCPGAWQGITIHHLLTHTAGIPDFTDDEIRAIQATPLPPSQAIARFRDLPLDFEPGSAWRYSNIGYILLGVIVEQASGQSYEAYLQENILDPLGMADSGYDHNRDDLAVGYTAGFEKAQFIDMTFPFSAGALYSTVQDLYRWDQALAGEQLLPKPLLDAMQTPHARIPDSGSASYGYGWVVDSLAGHRSIGHSGGIDGFAANMTRFPDDGLTVIVLSNQQAVNPGFISNQLAEIVLGQ